MPTVDLNSVVQITVVGNYLGQTTMNTFPHLVTAIPTPNVQQEAAFIAMYNAMKAVGKLFDRLYACCAPNWEQRQVWFQEVRPVRFRKVVITEIKPGVYTDIPGLTANVQGSIERYGELANRHEIGAVRIPLGTDDSCFDDGELTIAQKLALQNLGDQMVLPTTALGVTMRPLVGLGASTYPATFAVGTITQETVRVIRRRTVRVGI